MIKANANLIFLKYSTFTVIYLLATCIGCSMKVIVPTKSIYSSEYQLNSNIQNIIPIDVCLLIDKNIPYAGLLLSASEKNKEYGDYECEFKTVPSGQLPDDIVDAEYRSNPLSGSTKVGYIIDGGPEILIEMINNNFAQRFNNVIPSIGETCISNAKYNINIKITKISLLFGRWKWSPKHSFVQFSVEARDSSKKIILKTDITGHGNSKLATGYIIFGNIANLTGAEFYVFARTMIIAWQDAINKTLEMLEKELP